MWVPNHVGYDRLPPDSSPGEGRGRGQRARGTMLYRSIAPHDTITYMGPQESRAVCIVMKRESPGRDKLKAMQSDRRESETFALTQLLRIVSSPGHRQSLHRTYYAHPLRRLRLPTPAYACLRLPTPTHDGLNTTQPQLTKPRPTGDATKPTEVTDQLPDSSKESSRR